MKEFNKTITKEVFRERWLDCINELTSLELQKKSWLNINNTNPHWSFVEFYSSYFDNLFTGYDYEEYIHQNWLTKQEFEIIKDWHEALHKYDSPSNKDWDVEAILNDAKWLEIVKMGEKAKNKLATVLDEKEKKYLLEEIDYLKYT